MANPMKKILIIVIAVVVLVALFFALKTTGAFEKMGLSKQPSLQLLDTLEEQQELSEKQIKLINESVQRHISFPEGEVPFAVTITNAELLKQEQAFYKDAKDGDFLVIYSESQKALIYDPQNDVVVNVGPIQVDGEQEISPETQAPTPPEVSTPEPVEEEIVEEEVTEEEADTDSSESEE
jgi:hypothetical protein